MKYVIILNSKADQVILAEYNDLLTAFKHFSLIKAADVRTLPEEGKYFELAKYDEKNRCLDWESEELDIIGQPRGQWVTTPV